YNKVAIKRPTQLILYKLFHNHKRMQVARTILIQSRRLSQRKRKRSHSPFLSYFPQLYRPPMLEGQVGRCRIQTRTKLQRLASLSYSATKIEATLLRILKSHRAG